VVDTSAATVITANGLVLVRGFTSDQPSFRASVSNDARMARTGSSCLVSDNSGAANTAVVGTQVKITTAGYAANTNFDYLQPGQEVVLLPGDGLVWTGSGLNQAFGYGIAWRERALEDSEKK
jgi:hypothetical protein